VTDQEDRVTDHPDDQVYSRPKWYGATRFRSALEADWAATLDGIRTSWEYEPRTITLPSGAVYLPDFWLPDFGIWLEVKGPNTPRIEKAQELAETRACKCADKCRCEWPNGELVVVGHPAVPPPWDENNPYPRPRYGYMAWSSLKGPNVYLGLCEVCGDYSWVRMRRPLMCRKCRSPWRGGHLHSGFGHIDFHRAKRWHDDA
jgi:hypothetical protein